MLESVWKRSFIAQTTELQRLWSTLRLSFWSMFSLSWSWLMMEISKMQKNSEISSWLDAEAWTKGRWTTSLLKPFTSFQSHTKKRKCLLNLDLPCSRLTKTVVFSRIRLVRLQQWTLSLEAISNRTSTNKLVTLSSRLSSQRVYQTINMPAIYTTLAALKRSNLNIQKHKQVLSRVKEKDPRWELWVSESKFRNC